MVSHVRKAADSLISVREKHALGTPTKGAHTGSLLESGQESGMGCEMSWDPALIWRLPADNNLGKDKLPEQAEMLWSSWPQSWP